MRDRLRALQPRTILSIAAVGFLLYAYPGFLAGDGADRMVDARVGQFTDWNSPVMTQIWAWVHVIGSGPAPLLLLQLGLFLSGTYHLLAARMSPRAAAVATGALLWFPPVLTAMAVLTPAPLFAALALAGSAALASPRRGIQGLGLLALLLAAGVAPAASIALLPLVLFGLTWRTGWQRVVLAIAVWLGLVVAAISLAYVVVDRWTERPELALALDDIAGTLRYTGPLPDDVIREGLAGLDLVLDHDLRHDARRWNANPEAMMYGPRRLFDPAITLHEIDQVVAARWHLVRAYPRAYLRHRWHVAIRELGWSQGSRDPIYTKFVDSRIHIINLQHAARRSKVQEGLIMAVRSLDNPVTRGVYRPYVYLVIAMLALGFAVARHDKLAVMLAASALGFAIALVFTSAAVVPAATAWVSIASLVAVIALIARRRSA